MLRIPNHVPMIINMYLLNGVFYNIILYDYDGMIDYMYF